MVSGRLIRLAGGLMLLAHFDAWAQREPERKALLDRLLAGTLPDGWDADLPYWEPGSKSVATRAASGEVLSAIGPKLPELWGGSADLAPSNNTLLKKEGNIARKEEGAPPELAVPLDVCVS